MLSKDKQDKFRQIAEQLITKEYLGTPNIGIDKVYEEELTQVASEYLYSVFHNPNNTPDSKRRLIEVMDQKDIEYKSNILKIIL